jgi:UDP-N-acetylglucosamine 4,6-dehydratase
LYGATKLCADKLFVAGNSYSGASNTRFSVVRYGNVVGSRGSVIPFFLQMKKKGTLPITDVRMTRFWIKLEQGVQFVLKSLDRMRGGEIFVPKIPSMRVVELAKALAPECPIEVVGIRPGEKLHEVMVPVDDARNSVEFEDYYAIMPAFHDWNSDTYHLANDGRRCPDGFSYGSDTNTWWLTIDEMRSLADIEEL